MLLFFDKLFRSKTYLFRGRQYLSTVAPHMTQWLHINISTIHLACKAHPRIHRHVLHYNHLSCYGNLVPWENNYVNWFFWKIPTLAKDIAVWLKLVTKNSDIIFDLVKCFQTELWWSEFGILSSRKWNYFWP